MSTEHLPVELGLAFEPLHKRAFGMAVGVASGVFFLLLTAIPLLRDPDGALGLKILGEYFYGYTVSWPGVLAALVWGGVTGFVAGWFVAFCRNLVIAASLWLGRSRSELDATRDFLDHI